MGWEKLKLVLVGVLVLANAVMFALVRSYYLETEYIPEETLTEMMELLSRDGIAVAESTVDTKKHRLVICEGSRGDTYIEDTASALSQSGKELSFNTPDGYVLTMKNGDRFAFSSGFGIRYLSGNAPESYTWNGESPSLRETGTLESAAAQKAVVQFLERALPEERDVPSELRAEFVSIGTDSESGVVYCSCVQTANDAQIGNCSAVFAVFDGCVIEMNGAWCFSQIDATYSAQLIDQINILYSVKNKVLEERTENSAAVTEIRSLTLGYAAYFEAETDSFYLIPVWNASLSDGRKYTVNSLNGAFYTN